MSKIKLPISEELFNTFKIGNTFEEWQKFPLETKMDFLDMINSQDYKDSILEEEEENKNTLDYLKTLYSDNEK